jgi:hypothetical protein
MLQGIVEMLILEAPRGVGWAVLKVVTAGQYRGFRDDDVLVEGSLGLVTLAACWFLVYRWWP